MRLIAFSILVFAAAVLMGVGPTDRYDAGDIGRWMLFFSAILVLLELTIQRFWSQAREAVREAWNSLAPKKPEGYCPKCNYDLRGNPAATECPECGSTTTVTPK